MIHIREKLGRPSKEEVVYNQVRYMGDVLYTYNITSLVPLASQASMILVEYAVILSG
jgi:hypothetical protein